MPGITGLHGRLVALLVVQGRKPELEEYLLTRQMVELPVVGTVLKHLNCLVEHVLQVPKELNCTEAFVILLVLPIVRHSE